MLARFDPHALEEYFASQFAYDIFNEVEITYRDTARGHDNIAFGQSIRHRFLNTRFIILDTPELHSDTVIFPDDRFDRITVG